LIRLPEIDLEAVVDAAVNHAQPESPPSEEVTPSLPAEQAEVAAKTQRQRRRRAELGSPQAGPRLFAGLKPLSSKLVVGIFLLAVTGAAYVLIWGGPDQDAGEPAATWVAPDGEVVELSEPVIEFEFFENEGSGGDIATNSADAADNAAIDLWPRNQDVAAGPSQGASNSGNATTQVPEAVTAWPPGVAGASTSLGPQSVADATQAMSGFDYQTNVPSATATSEQGPGLTWGRQEAADGTAGSEPTPVQGWPPGFGPSEDVGAPEQHGMQSQTLHGNGLYTQSPATDVGRSDTRAATSPLRTGMLSGEEPASNTGTSGASLEGTIQFPQPRVDHERIRPGLY
jgi:hypothetical protein